MAGETTCLDVVRQYVARARAYNGICTKLVTGDGAPVAPAQGTVRAGAPLVFPAETVAVSEILPDLDQYEGIPIEFGRMEPTQSDPDVMQQFGMVAGFADAGQVNALSTLNIRGERSVTCSAECDMNPADGSLPAHCPAVCESFRQQPDALEAAAALDKEYGRNPDLDAMPMYCGVMSFKDVFDTRDMRSTGGADVSYAMDAAPRDSTVVERLREKGAIIYAKANLSEYNGGGGNPGGEERTMRSYGAGSNSTWPGTACNPYDTARETGGSSSGSAVSVGANLVHCSICEETGGSCRQPAWRSGIVGFVTTKGLIPYGGSVGAEPYLDRAGIHCRTVDDAALVLESLRNPDGGVFDPRDIYTALPPAMLPDEPYTSFVADEATADKPLAGIRVGIVREYMVKHATNDAAVSDLIDDEIKRVLRDELGAEIVESYDPEYPDDPDVENFAYTFQDALAEIVPIHLPELMHEEDEDGEPKLAVDGYDVTNRDYLARAAEGKAPLSEELNLRTINESPRTLSMSYHMTQYLLRRKDEKVTDWSSLNENSKYATNSRETAMTNWENAHDIASDGITRRVKMRDAMRLVLLKVMQQNDIDVLVNPTITIPPTRIGHASEPVVNSRPGGRFPTSANLGIPEITVPAGFNSVIYEPYFRLSDDKTEYESAANSTEPSVVDKPMPFGISFWAGPGEEPVVLEVASAYEAATRHRRPPEDFGPVRK